MKKLLWGGAILVVLAVIVGAWAVLQGSRGPSPTTPAAQSSLGGVATTTASGAGFAYTEDHPYYTISVVYPNTGNASEQAAIESALKSEINDYTKVVAPLDASVMPSLGQGYKLSLVIDYKTYHGSVPGAGDTTSYLFTVYSDTGGAHPNGWFDTFVFNQQGTQLGLGDLGLAGDYLAKLSQAATTQVTAQMNERLGAGAAATLFADGLAPNADNFKSFVVDGGDLLVEIPPYQAAAFAAGNFEVRVPLTDLR